MRYALYNCTIVIGAKKRMFYKIRLIYVLQSVAAKTMGPVAWAMPILIAVTSCSSFNSGTMVGSRYFNVMCAIHRHVHFLTLETHVTKILPIFCELYRSEKCPTACWLERRRNNETYNVV